MICSGPESSLPFVTFRNADEMVGVSEVKGSIDTSSSGGGKKVGDERKWISILFGDFVETSEVDTESE